MEQVRWRRQTEQYSTPMQQTFFPAAAFRAVFLAATQEQPYVLHPNFGCVLAAGNRGWLLLQQPVAHVSVLGGAVSDRRRGGAGNGQNGPQVDRGQT